MRAPNIKLICLSLFAILTLPNCTTVHNVEVCTVAGVLSAGMDCANTNNEGTRSMDLDETIRFLEPRIGVRGQPDSAGAMCFSAIDYTTQKTDLEVLCKRMGLACTYEAKELIKDAARRIETLQKRSLLKNPIKRLLTAPPAPSIEK